MRSSTSRRATCAGTARSARPPRRPRTECASPTLSARRPTASAAGSRAPAARTAGRRSASRTGTTRRSRDGLSAPLHSCRSHSSRTRRPPTGPGTGVRPAAAPARARRSAHRSAAPRSRASRRTSSAPRSSSPRDGHDGRRCGRTASRRSDASGTRPRTRRRCSAAASSCCRSGRTPARSTARRTSRCRSRTIRRGCPMRRRRWRTRVAGCHARTAQLGRSGRPWVGLFLLVLSGRDGRGRRVRSHVAPVPAHGATGF